MAIRKRNNSVTVLDIGTSKIVCIKANLLSDNTFEIVGIGYCATQGVRAGIITDLKAAAESINKAIELSESARSSTKSIYIGLSANTLVAQRGYVETSVIGKEISEKDLHKLILNAIEPYNKQPLQIIHTFLFDYVIDDHHNITSPIGLFGDKCGCEVNIISTLTNNLLNYRSCLEQHRKVEVKQYIADIYAACLACLNPGEMEMGTTLIDFGGGTTSIAVFENGSITYCDSVPLGGINITNDIAICLGISIEQAEKLKNLYGSTIATDNDHKEKIQIDLETSLDGATESDYQYVYRADIIAIIRSRVEEIFELLLQRMVSNRINHKNKIVLTGGSSRLPGIRELVAHIFSSNVRCGQPKFVENLDPSINLELTTAIGMLIHISDQSNFYVSKSDDDHIMRQSTSDNQLSLWQKIKNYFMV